MKIIQRTIILFFLSSFSLALQAQEQTGPVEVKPNGLSLTVFGASHGIGVTYDKMLSQRFSMEAGIGSHAAFLGFRYYIIDPSIKRWALYSGMSHSFFYPSKFFFYVPVGISYLASGNTHISLDIGAHIAGYWITEGKLGTWCGAGRMDISPFAGLKAGYRFNNSSRKIGERKTIHSVQVEAGGSSVFYSIRYDLNTQFGKSPFKFSIAPGLSQWHIGDNKKFLVPTRLTLQAGGSLNAEAGIDVSLAWYSSKQYYKLSTDWYWYSNGYFHALPYAGIRYQESRRGIVVLLGAVASIGEGHRLWMKRYLEPYDIDINEHSTVIWPSLSIGYTFRY